jgi:hypothetical protein
VLSRQTCGAHYRDCVEALTIKRAENRWFFLHASTRISSNLSASRFSIHFYERDPICSSTIEENQAGVF